MRKVVVQVPMDYIQSPDSHFVAQLVDDLLFPWEEAGSAEKPTVIDKDESFSETVTSQNPKLPQRWSFDQLFIH